VLVTDRAVETTIGGSIAFVVILLTTRQQRRRGKPAALVPATL
jgi:hypothetical protein